MRVLVTGSSGLVGSSLMETRDADIEWIPVNSKDADLRNFSETLTMIKKYKPDGIIHLAANVGGLFKNSNIQNSFEMFEDNLMMNMNVLKAAHYIGIQHVMICLSLCIFPDGKSYDPLTLHDGIPYSGNASYAWAKRMGEVLCSMYRDHGRRYFSIAPTNIYGPNDNFDLENSHVIPALIRKCEMAKTNPPFVVAGDGSQVRQFIYVKDLAKIMVDVFKNYNESVPYIICPKGSDISIAELVKHICDIFEYKGHVKFDTSKSNGQSRCIYNGEYGFEMTDIKKGLAETIFWYTNKCQK